MSDIPRKARPPFAQSPDFDRHMALLTADSKRAGQLVYRYEDTDETVCVPNIPANQPAALRAEALAWSRAQSARRLEQRLASEPAMPAFLRDLIVAEHRALDDRLDAAIAALRSEPRQDMPVRR